MNDVMELRLNARLQELIEFKWSTLCVLVVKRHNDMIQAVGQSTNDTSQIVA